MSVSRWIFAQNSDFVDVLKSHKFDILVTPSTRSNRFKAVGDLETVWGCPIWLPIFSVACMETPWYRVTLPHKSHETPAKMGHAGTVHASQ
jgi:hypothetical protein